MKPKFTRGPWCAGSIREAVSVIGGDGLPVATMYESRKVRPRETAEANAFLIAAAPDLYEALLECHEAMSYMSEYDIPLTLPDKVKQALEEAGYVESEHTKATLEAGRESSDEPFGFVCKADPDRTSAFFWEPGSCCDLCGGKLTPLYTRPAPARKPLSDEEPVGDFGLVMELCAALEIASYSIQDEEAKQSAIGACNYGRNRVKDRRPAPARKPLTDKEIESVISAHRFAYGIDVTAFSFARAVEKKVWEKAHGIGKTE